MMMKMQRMAKTEVMMVKGKEEIPMLEEPMMMASKVTSASWKERGHRSWPEIRGSRRSENGKSTMLHTYLRDRGASTACKGEVRTAITSGSRTLMKCQGWAWIICS